MIVGILVTTAGMVFVLIASKTVRDHPEHKSIIWDKMATSLAVLKDRGVFSSKSRGQQDVHAMLELTVHPLKVVRPISPLIYGSNLTAKTEFEMDVAKFAKETGVSIFRFPGSSSEGYHWQTGKFDFNDRFDNAPLSKIENVINFCEISGAKLLLQVNIESGTPQEAAQWVKYMSQQKGSYVQYWELGNEVYGDWERNYMPAEQYAGLVKDYALAMKEADPSIKIGANFGGPNFPLFDETLMKLSAPHIDFVSYHWYPNHVNKSHPYKESIHPFPEDLMANAHNIGYMVKRVDDFIAKYAPERKGKMEVSFLEWDGSWDAPASDLNYSHKAMMWSLANAIFYADTLGQFVRHGVTVALQYDFQEVMFGLIRGWDKEAGWSGDRWDGQTIRPKALALQLFARYFGDELVESSLSGSPVYFNERDWRADSYEGDVPYVTAYVSRFSKENKIAVALINKHADDDFVVKISVKEVPLKASGRVWILNGPDLKSQNDGQQGLVKIEKYKLQDIKDEFLYKVPAHTVNMIQMEW